MIEPYLIRQRLFLPLGVPASLLPLLHAWAVVENRKFCHEFMGRQLGLTGSEKAIRIAVARKLDALARFSKTSGYDFGQIDRGGGKGKEITFYGSFAVNRAVSWIQDQLDADSDTSNPFVAIDRYTEEAIARHIPKIQNKENFPLFLNQKKRKSTKRQSGACDRHTLSLRSVALQSLPNSTFESALILARLGFLIFPAHRTVNGVCSCPKALDCANPGKHPCIAGWQQVATNYEPSLIKLWEKFPYANIGIATGKRLPNGEFLVVIDRDDRSFGHGSISHLERNELGPLPATREHSSGSGSHKLYSYPRGFHSRSGALGQGIDIQSFGKFVIGPGSTHKSGRLYELTVDLPIARLPDSWAERIDAIRNKTLALIPEGRRRAWLLSCAGGMARDRMSPDLIFQILKDRRDRRCEKGTHPFSDEDLRGMVTYCLQQERSRNAVRVA